LALEELLELEVYKVQLTVAPAVQLALLLALNPYLLFLPQVEAVRRPLAEQVRLRQVLLVALAQEEILT
jgi:hypothetical protein